MDTHTTPTRPTLFRRAGAALLLASLALVASCNHDHTAGLGTMPDVQKVRREPIVRVRVVKASWTVQIDAPATLRVGPAADDDSPTGDWSCVTAPIVVHRQGRSFQIQPASGAAVAYGADALAIQPVGSAPIRVQGAAYPGTLVLHPSDDSAAAGGGIDVVNYTPLETYIPGVLDRELYPSWHPQAFAAQAIAARSYAIARCAVTQKRHFDLEATVASQAYGGLVNNAKALEAARATCGLVLTYEDRVLPAYYSSSTGGSGQDAAIAFPDGPDIPPLRGRSQGGWDAISPHYRWGPIHRSTWELTQRLAAWGRANAHPVANLRDLRQVWVSARLASDGRPAGFALLDGLGQRYDLKPEQFRFACNYDAPSLPSLPREQQLRSSHVSVRLLGTTVQFYDGRGYGHGVGMSQFGAQAMALQGYQAESILNFYYPEARIERAY